MDAPTNLIETVSLDVVGDLPPHQQATGTSGSSRVETATSATLTTDDEQNRRINNMRRESMPIVEDTTTASAVTRTVTEGGVGVGVAAAHPVDLEEDDEDDDAMSGNSSNSRNSNMMNAKSAAVEIPCETAEEAEQLQQLQEQQQQQDDFDEDDDYEYEEDDDAPFVSGFLVENNSFATSTNTSSGAATAADGVASSSANTGPATIEQEDSYADEPTAASVAAAPVVSKWREPTRAAVSMSLRAEQETTGSKRRLAQDLYRIMNQDTASAGFALVLQDNDSNDNSSSSMDNMSLWTIRLFQFDADSNLAKDMVVCGVDHVTLEMTFPDQYPFEPPFVRVVAPRFKRQTGFVMNGALCMELLTKDGWNPINDIESVIVSIRSLLVVGDGRLESAAALPEKKYNALLAAHQGAAAAQQDDGDDDDSDDDDDDDDDADGSDQKRQRKNSAGDALAVQNADAADKKQKKKSKGERRAAAPPAAAAAAPAAAVLPGGGSYSVAEAKSAYNHLSDYHKKKGWDTSGWWARKG